VVFAFKLYVDRTECRGARRNRNQGKQQVLKRTVAAIETNGGTAFPEGRFMKWRLQKPPLFFVYSLTRHNPRQNM